MFFLGWLIGHRSGRAAPGGDGLSGGAVLFWIAVAALVLLKACG